MTLLSICLFGCASLSTNLPTITPDALEAETASQVEKSIKTQREYLYRLARVAYPVVTKNAELCPKTRPYFGLITHSEKSYSKELRPHVADIFGITKDPMISYIIPSSPSDKAGLRVGDMILSPKDGQPMSMRKIRRLEPNEDGIVTLNVERGAQLEKISVTPETACNYPISYSGSEAVNAIAYGRSLVIFRGMMDFVKNDAELANVIGHELSHNTLGHVRKSITNYVLGGFNHRYTRPFESEADYVGLYMSARAGYEIEGMSDFWRRLGERNARNVAKPDTHPSTAERYLRLKEIEKEIAKKKATYLPLMPNLRE